MVMITRFLTLLNFLIHSLIGLPSVYVDILHFLAKVGQFGLEQLYFSLPSNVDAE